MFPWQDTEGLSPRHEEGRQNNLQSFDRCRLPWKIPGAHVRSSPQIRYLHKPFREEGAVEGPSPQPLLGVCQRNHDRTASGLRQGSRISRHSTTIKAGVLVIELYVFFLTIL